MKKNSKVIVILSISLVLIVVLFFNVFDDIIKEPNRINLVMPSEPKKDFVTKNEVIIKIDKDLNCFLDNSLVKKDSLENKLLLLKQKKGGVLTIIIKAEKNVPVANIVSLMEMANKNKFRTILGVTPNN